jgi:hypothetical protein
MVLCCARPAGDDFQSQTSDTFDHVVMCLLDFS